MIVHTGMFALITIRLITLQGDIDLYYNSVIISYNYHSF